MERNRRILILKVILKSMLLFAVLWLLWVLLAGIPGAPGQRPTGGMQRPGEMAVVLQEQKSARPHSGLQPLHMALVCCHTAA